MNFRVRPCIILVCLAFCTSVLSAEKIFVLPDRTAGSEIQVFSGNPLAPAATYPGADAAVANIEALRTPSGERHYTISRDNNVDALITTNGNFVVSDRSGAWDQPATAGEVTPDGKYLLVLSGDLLVYNAVTGDLVDSVDLSGSSPTDLAVSVDSRYAFVVDPGRKFLDRVDLSTVGSGTVDIITTTISPKSAAISAGPDGRIYLSWANRLKRIDPTDLSETGSIDLNGDPSEMYFTPDGDFGVAMNSSAGDVGWVFDLVRYNKVSTKIIKGTTAIPLSLMDPRVQIVSNDRFFMTSAQGQLVYEVQIPDGDVSVYAPANGEADEVNGIVASGEYPNAKYLYYANGKNLYRVTLASDTADTPQSTLNTAEGLLRAELPSTLTPTGAILYNNNQQIPEDGEFKPIVVRALDESGMPVFGAAVEFASTASEVTFPDAMAFTNRDGLAWAQVNPGAVTGAFSVDVTLGGVFLTKFELAVGNTSGGGGIALMTILGGQGQLLNASPVSDFFDPKPAPMQIRLQNLSGEPAPDQDVEWSFVSGSGILAFRTTTTDELGFTENLALPEQITGSGISWQQSIIRATWGESSVDFFLTGYPSAGNVPKPQVNVEIPSLNDRDLVGRSGETLTEALRFSVFAGSGPNAGQPIPNVGLTATTGFTPEEGPWVMCNGGTVLSGDDGSARCDLLVGGQIGFAPMKVTFGGRYVEYLNRFSITVLPGVPATLSPIQGNQQSGLPGQTLPVKLVAELRDADGNLLRGQAVTWSVVEAGTATLSKVVSTSDAQAQVSATATLGNTPGTVNVRVIAGSATGNFTLTVLSTATQLNKVSGDGQSAVTNTEFLQPLVVQLLDEDGVGVQGRQVSFSLISGPAVVSAPAATTNAQGLAQVTVTAGGSAGAAAVAASFGDLPAVVFNLSARPPGPALTASSFVNAASGFPGVTPGAIVSIYADGLATGMDGCTVASSSVLPYELAGVEVQFGEDAAPFMAPLFNVCNVGGMEFATIQAPFELSTGNTNAKVTVNGSETTIEGVPVLAVQPGLFEATGSDGLRYGSVVRPDGSYVSPSNPALRGEILALFATGLGPVAPPTGTNILGVPGQETIADVVVGVNHIGLRVLRAEYAIDLIGVYVVFFELPLDAEPGPARPLALGIRPPDGSPIIFGNGSTIAVQ